MRPLDWTDYSTTPGVMLDRAVLAGGAIWLVSAPHLTGVRIRFAPDYPAGIQTVADAKAARDTLPPQSGAWHRANALVTPTGIAVGAVVDRYFGYALIEAARRFIATPNMVQCDPLPIQSDREVLTRTLPHGTLTVEIDADGWRVAFTRRRGGRRTPIATIQATGLDGQSQPYLRPLPPAWDQVAIARSLALFSADHAERSGLTGPADLVPRERVRRG
jgi:hypothetical protein